MHFPSVFLLIFSLMLSGSSATTAPSNLSPKPDHSGWNALLQQHVSASGKVNYKAIKMDGKAFKAYLNELETKTPQSDWTREEAMSYWINAYNAFTVALIIEHYPVKSIRDIHQGEPWDVKWIKLGGKTYSLNDIEHSILRPTYKDARIHFAVNCAARSCPPLLNEAYTASRLEEQLERVTRKFINNTKFNQLSANSVNLSKIFEWYAEDFPRLIPFLKRYTNVPLNAETSIQYNSYDWSLNE